MEHGRNILRRSAAEGGEPHGQGERDAPHGCGIGTSAWRRWTSSYVSHAESRRQNIYSPKPVYYTLLQ